MTQFPSIKVLNTEPKRFLPEALEAMRQIATIDDVDTDRQYLLDHVQEYDGLFVALRHTLDKEILDKATRLKFIVTPTTGLNHIDLDLATQRGIKVLSLKGETEFLENVTATAELTWGILLSLCRKIPSAHKSVVDGAWARDLYLGTELKNKVLGVIGCGRLGKMVCRMGHAFRMRVLAHDINPDINAPEAVFVGLNELLAKADVVSIHLPLEEETRGFMDKELFSLMKNGAILVNTARGEIIDEDALLQALESGKLAGAASTSWRARRPSIKTG